MNFSKFKSMKELGVYARKHMNVFFLSILYGVLNNVLTLVSLMLGAYLVGLAFEGVESSNILGFFPLLLGIIILKGIFSYLHMLVCHRMAYLVLEDLRSDVYDAILKASPLKESKYRTGDISSIMMEDVESLELFFAHMLSDYFITAICLAVFVGIYFFFSWKAALISLVSSIVILIIPYVFGKRDEENGLALRKMLGKTNAGVVDTIQGLNEIIIFGREKKYINKIVDETMELNKIEIANGKIKGIQSGIIQLILSFVLIIIILLSHSMLISGEIKPFMVSVFIIMSLNIFIPVVAVSQTAGQVNLILASADRINNLLNEPSPLNVSEKTYPDIDTTSLILIKNLDFSYESDNQKKVLSNLNLEIKKGENIALTGESGVGKTTLVHMLIRFYDPDKGGIYLNGIDFRNLSPEEIRHDIAYVPQDVYLFHGTIIENLRLGKPDASMEEIKRAAKIALADGFIEALENGYNSFVGERGLTLSGGQKQRIAIARALVTGASILIMDEAVSNLDTESEKMFRMALENLRKEKTIITIAHRTSTILEADRVIKLKNGSVVFDGSPLEWKNS